LNSGVRDRLGQIRNNPIKRYAIGSNSPDLKIAADGSLVICLQKDSPGADKEANWLPAPDSPFSAVLRVYWARRSRTGRQLENARTRTREMICSTLPPET
jgi:hypothetical protein